MPPREAPRQRDEPPAPKKPRTEGGGTGLRKGKKKRERGKHKRKPGGNDWNQHSVARNRAAPGERMQGSVQAEQEVTPHRVRRPVMSEEDKRLQEAVRKKVYEAVLGEEARRNTIAFVYVHIFDAEDESEWDSVRPGDGTAQRGNNGWIPGTIQKIADYMELRSDQVYRDIRNVLERVEECARRGERYDGARRGAEIVERPERRNIKPGSMDEQLVGDWIEQIMTR